MLFNIFLWLGRHFKFIRLKYYKMFNDYPWGVLLWIEDFNAITESHQQHLTMEDIKKIMILK